MRFPSNAERSRLFRSRFKRARSAVAVLAALACVAPTRAAHGDDNIDMLAFEYRAHGRAMEQALRDQTDVAFAAGDENLPQRRRVARGIRIRGSVGQSLQSIGLGGALTRIIEQAL